LSIYLLLTFVYVVGASPKGSYAIYIVLAAFLLQ
jgi:hypothetical protein